MGTVGPTELTELTDEPLGGGGATVPVTADGNGSGGGGGGKDVGGKDGGGTGAGNPSVDTASGHELPVGGLGGG